MSLKTSAELRHLLEKLKQESPTISAEGKTPRLTARNRPHQTPPHLEDRLKLIREKLVQLHEKHKRHIAKLRSSYENCCKAHKGILQDLLQEAEQICKDKPAKAEDEIRRKLETAQKQMQELSQKLGETLK